MAVIAHSFEGSLLEVENPSRVPAPSTLRPRHCPCCGSAAGSPGSPRLVGHGLYRRQVLGHADSPKGAEIYIRRFLCLSCGVTISILPDELLPGRWYVAGTILIALVLHLLAGQCAHALRRAFGSASESRRWRSLERWARHSFDELWPWKAAEIAWSKGAALDSRDSRASMLRRFLNHLGATNPYPPDQCRAAARRVAAGMVHTRDRSWLMSRTA